MCGSGRSVVTGKGEEKKLPGGGEAKQKVSRSKQEGEERKEG